MIKGLYTSALGMTTQMKKMDVISNNIANVDNVAFKKDTVVTRAFSKEMAHRLNDSSDIQNAPKIGGLTQGVFVDEVYTNFSSGSMRNTEGSLDIAIDGNGFFSINTINSKGEISEKYSKDGSFTISPNGKLITKDGNSVLGQQSDITLPLNAKITINEKGTIYANNIAIDTLKIVSFEEEISLRKFGNNLYDSTTEPINTFNGTVLQGQLENSNVNTVSEMIDMITVSRTYEANQRIITIHDTILGKAVTEIARR